MFFRKKTKVLEEKKPLTESLIVMERLSSSEDDVLVSFAKALKEGKPLILNFDLLDVDAANKALAFLSGVVFGIDGSIQDIREKVYLFADKHAFADGSLKQFLDIL